MRTADLRSSPSPSGLGLDAGGTQTRWAVANADGDVRAQGSVAPISGLQLDAAGGRAAIGSALAEIAARAGSVGAVTAGLTGFDAMQSPQLCSLLSAAFDLPTAAVQAMSDIEMACRAAFAPGAGYVVYAGTGSIAAFIDENGQLQRAGGRGVVIDDAGGGHWIAREALRLIWRAEDERPGTSVESTLARMVFAQIGGSEWSDTRRWAYGATRGELGSLALAVAAAADADPQALAILRSAGEELARLARALIGRHGLRPIALTGRVFDLHPAIDNALRAALPDGTSVQLQGVPAHHAAARLAALNHLNRTHTG